MTFRDWQGRQIELLRWADLFEDFEYRLVRDEFVLPTTLQVRTMWEGIDDIGASMFLTGVSANGTGWMTLAESRSEAGALVFHAAWVNASRSGST